MDDADIRVLEHRTMDDRTQYIDALCDVCANLSQKQVKVLLRKLFKQKKIETSEYETLMDGYAKNLTY